MLPAAVGKMANNVKKSIALIVGGGATFALLETARGNPKFYSNVLMPTLHKIIPAETAHSFAAKAMRFAPVPNYAHEEVLHTKVWNKEFKNPIGIAAGFDKYSEAMARLSRVGFGFVEIGSVTPIPQDGNAKPRVFRLAEDDAVFNRYGFNSSGHEVVASRLYSWRSKDNATLLGVNLGKNKNSEDNKADYVAGIRKFSKFADYIVVNISSPNTRDLRKLQGAEFLQDMLLDIKTKRDSLKGDRNPTLLVKLAPDLNDHDIESIAKVVTDKKYGVDGLIISNTTVSRPETLISHLKAETGGLSGPPLKEMSTQLIRQVYALTGGKIPIIGVGGISTAKDAYEKIKAGASLVQFYTALVYNGPPIVSKIKMELAELLLKDGYRNVGDAVSTDHKR